MEWVDNVNKAQLTLSAIWMTGLAPVFLAVLMYFGDIWIPEGRTYHGVLIDSELKASTYGITDNDQKTLGSWQVVLTESQNCDSCEKWKNSMENFHKAIGKERKRVLVTVVEAPENETIGGVPGGNGIWIVDPLGNLVFRFPVGIDPNLILKDLKRLLKLSKVG